MSSAQSLNQALRFLPLTGFFAFFSIALVGVAH